MVKSKPMRTLTRKEKFNIACVFNQWTQKEAIEKTGFSAGMCSELRNQHRETIRNATWEKIRPHLTQFLADRKAFKQGTLFEQPDKPLNEGQVAEKPMPINSQDGQKINGMSADIFVFNEASDNALDGELGAMVTISNALKSLDEYEQARVLNWINNKYKS